MAVELEEFVAARLDTTVMGLRMLGWLKQPSFLEFLLLDLLLAV